MGQRIISTTLSSLQHYWVSFVASLRFSHGQNWTSTSRDDLLLYNVHSRVAHGGNLLCEKLGRTQGPGEPIRSVWLIIH